MAEETIVNENIVSEQHTLEMNLCDMPLVWHTDFGLSKDPILHVDRRPAHDVLLLILTGCMPVVEDHVEYFLRAGDLFFLKHGVHHFGKTPFDAGTSWLYVHFTLPEVEADVREISPEYSGDIHFNSTWEDYRAKITLPKHLRKMLGTNIETKFRKLHELYSSRNQYLKAFVNTCMHDLLVDIYMYNIADPDPDSPAARVSSIIQFLTRHVAEPFDASAIEEHIQLSYKYLGEIFKKNTGMTIHECHTRMKIERACKMLKESDMPITAISDSLGFSDPLYFSNVFKKYVGSSPRTWRKS